MLMACVQIQVGPWEEGEPVVSFELTTSEPPADAIPQPDAPDPTVTVEPDQTSTVTPAPTHTSAPTPTSIPTSLPTSTPSPTQCLPDATFFEDVTVPDDTAFAPGEAFDKVWRVRSSGCAAWPAGTRWVFVGGDRVGAPAGVAVPDTPVGETVLIAVPMVAPGEPGTYRGSWQMQGAGGELFGDRVYVQIVVAQPAQAPAPQPSQPKPTVIPTPEPPPP